MYVIYHYSYVYIYTLIVIYNLLAHVVTNPSASPDHHQGLVVLVKDIEIIYYFLVDMRKIIQIQVKVNL